MSERRDEDTSSYPALGRWLTWVDSPGSATKIFYGLAALCAVLFLAGFTYEKHAYFTVENFGGFFALYGFVMFTFIIFAAKGLRVLIKRPEDYYGDKAIDSEEYPDDQLERIEHDR
jgi:hypothetical protein